MLKTNSKQARENIRAYIEAGFDPSNYTDEKITGFKNIARFILETFRAEVFNDTDDRLYHKTEVNAFFYWCAGLPSCIDTCYYYNRSAVQDLGDILDENETERARFSEAEAEACLTNLIYRELKKAVKEW